MNAYRTNGQSKRDLSAMADALTKAHNAKQARVLPDLTQDDEGMSDAMVEELLRLRAENKALKAQQTVGLKMKVSDKGALSIYGMGRFPVTLYKSQWLTLLAMADKIKAFIQANDHALRNKDD